MPKVQQTGGGNGGRGGRRGRGPRVATSLADINVVPLVDVMLVLLIIFMVTAPMMTQGLAVNLPQARHSAPPVATPIYVTIPASFSRDHLVQIGDDPVRIEILQERIKQALLERADKNVFVRADATVTAQDLYTVWDKLKDGGVEKVAMGARPVGK
jgi:biopolymer transport protein TolR